MLEKCFSYFSLLYYVLQSFLKQVFLNYKVFFVILIYFFYFEASFKLADARERISQNEGTKLKLYCVLQESTKKATFSWFLNSNRIFSSTSPFSISTAEDESVLSVYPLGRTHGGNYTCQVQGSSSKEEDEIVRQQTLVVVKGP